MKIQQGLSDLREQVKIISGLNKDILELRELAEISEHSEDLSGEIQELEKKIKKQELKTFLSDRYDKGNAILSVYAGAGGVDAEDW